MVSSECVFLRRAIHWVIATAVSAGQMWHMVLEEIILRPFQAISEHNLAGARILKS